MKTILCYGDSLTYAMDPATWDRYEYDDRWTSVMESQLGSGYKVIVEGLSGRTSNWDLPYLPFRNGKEPLMMLLESHSPLDLVIIMLGTNDLVSMLNKTAEESAAGMMSLIRVIYQSLSGPGGGIPKVMIVCPPAISKLSDFMGLYYDKNVEESKKLPENYKKFAEQFGCSFIDSNQYIKTCIPDGIHISRDSQKILGIKIAESVKKLF